MLRTPWSSGDRARACAGGRDLRPVESPGRSVPRGPPARRRAVPEGPSRMSSTPIRPIALCVLLTLPALVLRASGAEVPAVAGLLLFGTAVVASSFLLAWAAEAARVDIAGPLAIAILAV